MAKSRSSRFLVVIGLLGLVVSAGATLGCGGDGDNLAEFVGTWKYTAGDVTFACPGQADSAISLGNLKAFHLGIKSDLVDLSSNCGYRFDVKDKVASIQQGQTCAFDDGNGGTATESPTSWTFTLNSATTSEETLTTATTFIDGTVCTISGTSHLEKISKD
jgi:hypothetical protein